LKSESYNIALEFEERKKEKKVNFFGQKEKIKIENRTEKKCKKNCGVKQLFSFAFLLFLLKLNDDEKIELNRLIYDELTISMNH
jgi:hypothetical protein